MVIIADFSKFIIMPWPLLFHSSTSEFILKCKLNNANIVQNRPYKAKPISFGEELHCKVYNSLIKY